jgi:pimeloyl-ACP methyl ester carboxylesterase
VDGARVAYDVRGAGPAVLFLHAFPLHSAMWEAQAAALAPSHSVVRMDARGFGGSARGEGLLSMERIAEDAAFLLRHLGFETAAVCGLSMGGYAAFALVRRHPTLRVADSAEGRAGRASLAERARREGSAAVAEEMLPRLLGETTRRDRPELAARVRDMVLAADPAALADALAGLAARADSTSTLREIRVPTLVLCGAEDVLSTPAEMGGWAEGIAGARFQEVPAAGHLANLENAPAFNAALLPFLATLA